MGNTQQVSDFVYFCSPLIPNEGKENALGYAQDLYDMFQLPALCLSIAITPLITFRTITLRLNHPDLLNTLGVTLSDLDTIVRGYKFPLETIQISEVLKGSKESQFDQVFEEFATTSHNFNTLLTQESIKQNLRATVNLQINYPSGDQVFDFLIYRYRQISVPKINPVVTDGVNNSNQKRFMAQLIRPSRPGLKNQALTGFFVLNLSYGRCHKNGSRNFPEPQT